MSAPEMRGGWRWFVSLLLFGLFGEWLYPLHTMLGEDQTRVLVLFVVLTAVLLLAGCFRLPVYVYAPVPPICIVVSLLFLYGRGEGVLWFVDYGGLLVRDLTEMLNSGRLYNVSLESRGLLLLIGWSLLVISVQMLALGKQSILLFFAATVLYLLTLEVALDVQLYSSLIRTALFGLLLQMALFFSGMAASYNTVKPKGSNAIWLSGGAGIAIACLAASVWGGSLLPERPVQFVSWQQVARIFSEWNSTARPVLSTDSYSVSGYSRNDNNLGAPLKLRHDTFFTAISPVRTYWRGESKSIYTGRGWADSADRSASTYSSTAPAGSGWRDAVEMEMSDSPAKEQVRQVIKFEEPLSGEAPFFTGGIPVKVEGFLGKNGQQLEGLHTIQGRYDSEEESVWINYSAAVSPVYGYQLTSLVPSASTSDLRGVLLQTDELHDMEERYLQLPNSVPERVRKLGTKLVSDMDNRYDAVMSVMSYLKQHHTYSLESAVPPSNADFVDRFLFVDQSGYCDHFSTAMVVLLRSGGIPARWVKGFAPGEQSKNGEDLYTVSYADAHAWVEVYFPGKGWIPFDPTPGYEGVLSGEESSAGASVDRHTLRESIDEIVSMMKHTSANVLQALGGFRAYWNEVVLRVLFPVTLFLLAAGFLILVFREMYKQRDMLRMWVIFLIPRKEFLANGLLLEAADCVWRRLYRKYGSKPQAMTAREYMKSIILRQGGIEAVAEEFMKVWETIYYGGNRLNRTDSRNFLRTCYKLLVGQR